MKSTKYKESAKVFYSVIIALALVLPNMAFATPVPDTGQTGDYTATFGEDSDYTINPHSYTDLGNGIVRDNVTGLEWQQATAPGTYTWQQAIDYCNNLSLGGKDDWRLPTIKELSTLVDSSIPYPSPTINTTYFPGTVASLYWSSTTDASRSDPHGAWGVVFYNGVVYSHYKTYPDFYVRAVRSGQSNNNFVDNNDGTISDTGTGLMWQKATAPGTYTWEQAITYCETLTLADKSDWRLPNRNELQSIVDYGRYNPSIDTTYFSGTVASYYWSSTTVAGSTHDAWYVDFGYGDVSFYFGDVYGNNKTYDYCVRAVRSGQCEPPAPTLTYPADGAVLNDSTPDLAWSQGGSVNYFHVRIASDANFTNLICDTDHVNSFNYTPGDVYCHALVDGTYWWMVRAHGTNGEWSLPSTRSFVISTASSIPQGEIVLQPGPSEGMDCWFNDAFNSHEDDEKLWIGGWGDNYYSLIKFDISNLPDEIISAEIYLYCYWDDDYTNIPMYLDRVTQSWNENTQWSTRPSYVYLRVIPTPTDFTWYSIDITDLYRDWKNGVYENYGIQLRPVGTWEQRNTFHSSDYTENISLRPKLVMHISNPTVNLSADANCQSKDLFNTSPTNLEPIYVSSTLPIPAGNYDFYLVRDKSSWKDGDPICPVGASDGLIAYYPFNGNANDESGNGNHGTVNGALLTSDSAGNANSAYGFNGIDSYITVGDKLDAQNGDLTLSAWVKADTYAQSAIIINKGMTSNGSPPGCGYGLHVLQESPVQTAGIHFRFDDSDYGIRRDVFIPVNQVPIARFIFLTGTLRHIDSSTVQMSIYLNGKLYSSKTFPSGPANDTNIPFAIGAHYRGEYGPVTAFFNGVIDEVKVYNRSLSDAEVQELYNQPTCITSKSISIDNNGHFCDLLWTPPVGDNNQYDIVLDVNGNGFFDIATDFLDSNIAVGATTLVELTSFTALPKSGKVTLNWTTESEIDNAGFNIYRAETENGSYIKINAALISTKGSSTQGASYEFVDNDVQNRKTYYYKLEDIDLEGKSTMHGPVSATPRLIHVLSK